MRPHPIALIEACYHLGDDDGAWLARIAEAARPFGRDRGGYAVVQRVTGLGSDGHCTFETPAAWYGDAPSRALVEALWRGTRVAADMFLVGPMVISGSFAEQVEATPLALAEFEHTTRPFDVADVFGLLGHDGHGQTITLAHPATRRIRLTPGERRMWRRVAAHLGTALRLRRRVARGDVPDAVLTTRGELLHAEGDAIARRGAIVEAHARTRHALAARDESLWHGLASGRWSLADRIDSDGKRFVLAMQNELEPWRPPTLSPREAAIVRWAVGGASLKAIGYALGVATGTVSTHLARAMKKLGVDSRAALTTLWRALSAHASTDELTRVPLAATTSALDVAPLGVAERDVLRLVVAGASNEAVSRARGTTVATVRKQVGSIYRKLGVASRAELLALVLGRS